jgi:uncharacterized protein YciW
MSDSRMEDDVIAALAGAAGHAAIAAAVAPRAGLLAASQANYRAVMTPADPGSIPAIERRAIAARIARLNGDTALAAHYGAEIAVAADARQAAMLRHVDLVTTRPSQATRADIDALRDAGVAEPDIVRLSQLIAFVNYQVRVIAALRLIGAAA